MAKLFDLDRGMEDEAAPDGSEEPAALLVHGEVWIIGPVTFNVFKGLDNSSLNNAEFSLTPVLHKQHHGSCHSYCHVAQGFHQQFCS